MDIHEYIAQLAEKAEENDELEEGEGMGKIAMILKLHKKGYSNKEIIEAGYNKSTVYRQVGEYKKLFQAPVKSYMGYEAYEGRIQRIMKSKSMTREEAAEWIAAKDAEE